MTRPLPIFSSLKNNQHHTSHFIWLAPTSAAAAHSSCYCWDSVAPLLPPAAAAVQSTVAAAAVVVAAPTL
jgi:hypothetical protein